MKKILLLAIFIGIVSDKIIEIPKADLFLFFKEPTSIVCFYNKDNLVGCLNTQDIRWIKFIPNQPWQPKKETRRNNLNG